MRARKGAYSPARADMLPLGGADPRALALSLRDRLLPDPVLRLDLWLSEVAATPASGRVVLVGLDPSCPDDAFMLHSATLPAEAVARALAAAQGEGGRLEGHVPVWSPDAGWATWRDMRRLPVLTEPPSVGNAHSVIGAYAEQRPCAFVGVLFAMALFAAAIASVGLAAGSKHP